MFQQRNRIQSKFTALAVALSLGFATPAFAQFSGDVVKVGFLTDISGVYSDNDGQGGVEAIKMAVEDFGALNGKKVEFLYADHLNKVDVASAKAREWFDRDGLDMLVIGANSGAALALAKLAADKKKPMIAVTAATARLTNEECTPYTVAYAYDTVSVARGTGGAIVDAGGKDWFFLTADYAFGTSLEKETAAVVEAKGGRVMGSVKHPVGSTPNFSALLLQAQASKAKILGLATSGDDLINAIKVANEFGINKTMNLAAILTHITEVHALGLKLTQGMYLTDGWYWDQDDASRAWAKRYFEKMKKMPSSMQAADYSAVTTYLKAVKAAGTDDGDKVMATLKSTKISDMYTKSGMIRTDGRMVYDMYLRQVKTPAESKGPWDYYKTVKTIPGDEAFTKKSETKCALWK
ncbi:MAG: ABC transporter substrate-binding protein [Gammaproteobacteria bacterium]|nr:ABC transporter substrate-binding protein [Gammaproteobacteria bacterium]MBU1440237.1 ABC transporter substrate-binding protein [Gammaproteobacteria bacterium]MBU2288514.1 ABC transporter substrate-binding protein [Gammaproteobacteria bacterium]MBU2407082.1 ABC transporter substrate-binding protein [Gammaproteobacteria bacterium]